MEIIIKPYDIEFMPYPGIYRLKLPLTGSPLKYVNAYLLTSSSGHLLIDTGWNTKDTFLSLTNQLDAIGIKLSDISRIVITHAHIDHYGMAARIQRSCGGTLAMHWLEKKMAALCYRNIRQFACQSNRQLRTCGVDEKYIPDPQELVDRFVRLVEFVSPDVVYHGGETLQFDRFNFKIIWTPGHSPGHICLYEKTYKIFFSGDHVLPGITSHVGLNPMMASNPLDGYIRSLNALLFLDIELILPAHGRPFKGSESRLKQLISHHQNRKAEIRQHFVSLNRPASAFDLATAMSWYAKGQPTSWHILSDFDKRLAITEVMAHLESMVTNGELFKNIDSGIIYYGLTGKTEGMNKEATVISRGGIAPTIDSFN